MKWWIWRRRICFGSSPRKPRLGSGVSTSWARDDILKTRVMSMKHITLPALLVVGAMICSGQTTPAAQTTSAADPTLDNTGLPFYVKLIPEPVKEPWQKITPKERFDLYASYTFSPYAALTSLAGGAISQGINSPKEWGQGWGAFGKRRGEIE